MSERITNVEVQEFLQDYKKNSETLILEEGKEKNELLESARKRGIIISKNDKDLGVIKTIYCFTSKANANKTRVPKDEFIKIFPQIIGRPMNNCHDRKFILGFYVDYKYILKEEKAIAYAVFFKSAYPKLWEKAKDFQKKKRLSSSYEIWSPEDKRKQLADGTEELHNMAIAGGALIFEEYGDEPAFKDAKVLKIARKELEQIVDDKCLVYASKHKEEELITSAGEMTMKKVEVEKPTDTKIVVPAPTIQKIKCSNCSGELEHNGIDIKVKCPKCFAILNKDGVMQYPPQIKDFRLLCPECSVNNWLIVSKKEDKAKVRCQSCAKEYNLTFATKKSNELINKTQFLYTGKVRCLQCHTTIYVSGTSAVTTREVKCKKCGLEFSYDITNERYKKISQIEEVIPKENKIDNKKESSEEGGNKMAKEKKIEKASEKKVEVKVEPKKEVKIEEKKVEVKVEVPKKIETKVEDKKEEDKETPKAEKTPKTTEKVEEPKAKEKPEAKTKTKEDKVEIKKEKKVEVKKEKAMDKKEVKVEVKKVPKAEEPKVKKETKVEPKIDKKKVEATKKETPKEKSDLVRRAVGRILDTKKALRKAKAERDEFEKQVKDLTKQVELYESSAKDIIKRREELGDYAKDMSDEDILNDDKFGKVKAEKENTILRAKNESDNDEIVGSKVKEKSDEWYKNKREAIDKVAFKKD